MPYVFKHPDTDNFVEPAILWQIPIIQQLQVDFILQAFGVDPFSCQLQLLFAQGNAKHLDPELTGGKSRQATPTTANIEQVFARL